MVELFLKSLLSLISTSNALLAWSSQASHVIKLGLPGVVGEPGFYLLQLVNG